MHKHECENHRKIIHSRVWVRAWPAPYTEPKPAQGYQAQRGIVREKRSVFLFIQIMRKYVYFQSGILEQNKISSMERHSPAEPPVLYVGLEQPIANWAKLDVSLGGGGKKV